MNLKELYQLLKETFQEWREDKASQLGASLAYYTVFSMAPILLIAISIAGLIFGEEAARGELLAQISGTVGPTVGEAIQSTLESVHTSGAGVWATVVSVVALLFGASGVFAQLQDALNTIWGVQPKPGRGWLEVVKNRFWSFSVVVGIGFLLLVSLVVSSFLAAINTWITPESRPGGAYLWHGVHLLFSFGLLTLLFAMIYKILPDVKIAWQDVWVGAAVTALLFSLGKHLIGLYLGQSGAASAYGAAGSLVIVLLWVYYSSQIFIFGAEFTQVYANKFGTPTVTERAEPIATETAPRKAVQKEARREAEAEWAGSTASPHGRRNPAPVRSASRGATWAKSVLPAVASGLLIVGLFRTLGRLSRVLRFQ